MNSCWGVNSALPSSVAKKLPRRRTWAFAPDFDKQVLFIVGAEQLRWLQPHLEDYPGSVIVFDCKPNLDQWGIPLLDLTASLAVQLSTPTKIRFKNVDHPKKLLEKTARSFVSNFLTLSLKIRDPERRNKLKSSVFESMWSGKQRRIKTADPELASLLDSKEAANLIAALNQVKRGTSIPEAAKLNGVSEFDLSYVQRVVQGAK